LDEDGELGKFLNDAYRFMLIHRQTIERYPLQAYISALIFSPTESVIRRQFAAKHPKWITTYPVMNPNWDSCLIAHECPARVASMAFSADGKQLALALQDDTQDILIINTDDGEVCQKINNRADGEDEPSSFVAYLANGRLVSNLGAFRVGIWSAKGALEKMSPRHASSVVAIAVSHDGLIASSSGDSVVRVWNEKDGTSIDLSRQPTGSTLNKIGCASTLCFSRSGKLAIAEDSDITVVELYKTSGEYLRNIYPFPKGRARYSLSLNFTEDERGEILAVSSNGSKVELWHSEKNELLQTSEAPFTLTDFTLLGGKQHVMVLVGTEGDLCLMNYITGEVSFLYRGHASWVSRLVSAPNGLVATSAENDTTNRDYGTTVKIWDLKNPMGETSRTPTPAVANPQLEAVDHFVISNHSRTVVAGSRSMGIRIFDPRTGSVLHSSTSYKRLQFSDDDRFLVSDTYHHYKIGYLDCEFFDLWQEISLSPNADILRCAYSPNFHHLVAVCRYHYENRTGGLEIWTLESGMWVQSRRIPIQNVSKISHVAISADGSLVAFDAMNTDDVYAVSENPDQGEQDLAGYADLLNKLKVTRDEYYYSQQYKLIVLQVYSVETGKLRNALIMEHGFDTLNLSPDNEHIALSFTGINAIDIWNIDSGQFLTTIRPDVPATTTSEEYVDTSAFLTHFRSVALGPAPNLQLKRDCYRISHDWIMWNGEGVIYLPVQYRPHKYSRAEVRDGAMLLQNSSDRSLSFFAFSPDIKPSVDRGPQGMGGELS
jgi:WD40 repeat protein